MASTLLIVLISLLGLSGVFSNIADFDCFERADQGVGRAYFEVYTWQATNNTCTKFVYGGVRGNRNRFTSMEECFQSCHDAILRDQLTFDPTRRYRLVNRLYSKVELELSLERVDDGFFKITVPLFDKVLTLANDKDTSSVSLEVLNNNQTQHWDVIPTGEQNYYRIKTRTRPYGQVDYALLGATWNNGHRVTVVERENSYFSQQWQIL